MRMAVPDPPIRSRAGSIASSKMLQCIRDDGFGMDSLPVQRSRMRRAVRKRCSQCQRARARRALFRPAHERRIRPLRCLRRSMSWEPVAMASAFIDARVKYTAFRKVFDIYRRNAGFKAEYPPAVVSFIAGSLYSGTDFTRSFRPQHRSFPRKRESSAHNNVGQSPSFFLLLDPRLRGDEREERPHQFLPRLRGKNSHPFFFVSARTCLI